MHQGRARVPELNRILRALFQRELSRFFFRPAARALLLFFCAAGEGLFFVNGPGIEFFQLSTPIVYNERLCSLDSFIFILFFFRTSCSDATN